MDYGFNTVTKCNQCNFLGTTTLIKAHMRSAHGVTSDKPECSEEGIDRIVDVYVKLYIHLCLYISSYTSIILVYI